MKHLIGFTILLLAAVFINYYIIVLVHEWSHSTLAWLFGYKHSLFDIRYGGWLMLNVDEMVPYDVMIKNGNSIEAALTGISGITSNAILFMIAMCLFSNEKTLQNKFYLLIIYGSLIMNLMPIVGYIPSNIFTNHGDVGWFVVGLNISPFWVFFLGTPLVVFAIIYLFRSAIFKVYHCYPLSKISEQSSCLIISLIFLFLPLFIHGQNPFSDRHAVKFTNILFSLLMFSAVPLLFILCYPGRKWVKSRLESYYNLEG